MSQKDLRQLTNFLFPKQRWFYIARQWTLLLGRSLEVNSTSRGVSISVSSRQTLATQTFVSVRRAAETFAKADNSAFALISDLTTFIQVGDLLVKDIRDGFTIVEVKEGDANRRIIHFAEFLRQNPCERAVELFRALEGEHSYKHLLRVRRQAARMDHVAELMRTGTSTDPDNNITVTVPDKPFPENDYDEELTFVLEESKKCSWAIEHIDDCL